MEDRRFDDLSRLAARSSRRQAFKALGGGAAGGLLAMLGVRRGVVEAQTSGDNCCPPDRPRLCGYTCLDVTSDMKNCGDCGTVCAKGQVCSNGICTAKVKCPKGETSCGGVCVTLSSDPSNCGACDSVCAAGASCASGVCQCPGGTTNCGGACVDLSTDPSNCGTCGTVCDPANAQGMCASGQCQIDTCDAGYADCGGDPTNGCETHVSSDPDNCGTCGNVCASGQTCENGSCAGPVGECTPDATRSCYSGPAGSENIGVCHGGTQTCLSDGTWGACVGEVTPTTETCNNLDDDCDGVVDNGFDRLHDVRNCGTCGNVCQPLTNATVGCINGSCGILTCDAGFADCDNNPASGCEVETGSDPDNCGACGNVCASGETCQSGSCVDA